LSVGIAQFLEVDGLGTSIGRVDGHQALLAMANLGITRRNHLRRICWDDLRSVCHVVARDEVVSDVLNVSLTAGLAHDQFMSRKGYRVGLGRSGRVAKAAGAKATGQSTLREQENVWMELELDILEKRRAKYPSKTEFFLSGEEIGETGDRSLIRTSTDLSRLDPC
jgi:hypothetical protein